MYDVLCEHMLIRFAVVIIYRVFLLLILPPAHNGK